MQVLCGYAFLYTLKWGALVENFVKNLLKQGVLRAVAGGRANIYAKILKKY